MVTAMEIRKQGYKLIHVLGGVLIGMGGLAGIPFAMVIIYREWSQETEQVGTKSLTNKAWQDMTEWATGAAIGTVIHLVGLVWLISKLIGG